MNQSSSQQPPQQLCLNLMWHQHQPYYRRAGEDELIMPWARLHAIKDYYDMAALVEQFPAVHQTINLVPCLMEQLQGYAEGRYTDRYLRISRTAPDQLSEDDLQFMLERFFDAEVSHMVAPYARYQELYDLRGGQQKSPDAARLFKEDDIRDLQVWFNLTWFDPLWKENEGDLCYRLIQQGRNYSEDDKHKLLDKQHKLIGEVLPLHKRLQDEGLLELTTTPFYHPILPLLCDTDEARVALPDIALPEQRFQHPEDAAWHVEQAIAFYENRFGKKPRGMWPSEGSVSPAIVPILARHGIEWIATDEDILGLSLERYVERDPYHHLKNPDLLYRPYSMTHNDSTLRMVFRDRHLSDSIGFRYAQTGTDDAVNDFMHRLETIARRYPRNGGVPPLVSVILDGENCWEHYHRDGHDFLETLYQRLTDTDWVEPVTVSEYLDRGPETPAMPKLFSGSWIMHNFRVWIGHEEDNRAWDLVSDLRAAVAAAEEAGEVDAETLQSAWQQVYVAEGSDWYWWYGDDRTSGQDDLWDQLFRDHIAHGYELLGLDVPGKVHEPIASAAAVGGERFIPPQRMLAVDVDGRDTQFFEWYGSASYAPGEVSGVMQAADSEFDKVFVGFDEERLYLRVDFDRPARDAMHDDTELLLVLVNDTDTRLSVCQRDGNCTLRQADGTPFDAGQTAVDEIVEVSIPWQALDLAPGDTLGILFRLQREGTEVDVCPQGAPLKITAPDDTFWLKSWCA